MELQWCYSFVISRFYTRGFRWNALGGRLEHMIRNSTIVIEALMQTPSFVRCISNITLLPLGALLGSS
jgi:hypothetical protein